MKLHFISTDVITEGIEDKIPFLTSALLGNSSKWTGKGKFTPDEVANFVLSLSEWDPTKGQAKFVPYIVKQLVNQYLKADPNNTEDLGRIAAVLSFFHTNSKSSQWKHPKDINQFQNWKHLEALITSGTTPTYKSKRQQKREITGIEKLDTVAVPNSHNTTYSPWLYDET